MRVIVNTLKAGMFLWSVYKTAKEMKDEVKKGK